MLTVAEFCERFHACEGRREWAVANCRDLRHAWEILPHEDLIWAATRPGVLTDGELRLFACWCVRQVWHLLTDDRSRRAVEVAERFTIGEATVRELSAARAASDAARAAADAAAAWSEAGWEAASAAAAAARSAAAADAVRAAAAGAARAARAAAAAKAAQAEWLRANCEPNWDVGCDSAAV